MATVNKDFRVKAGLIVEGANATVNGDNIVTEDAAQTLTNKTIGDGGIVFNDGTTGNNQSIYTEGNDLTVYGHSNVYINTNSADIILQPDGSAKIWGDVIATQGYADGVAGTAETNAKSYADGLASNYEAAGSIATAIGALTTDDIEEGSTNLYFTGTRALSATASAYDAAGAASTAETNAKSYADGLASNYDPAGSAASAITSANGYTDTAIGNLDTDDIAEGSTNLYFTSSRALSATSSAYDAAGSAATAETNAKSYADGLASNYDPAGAAATAESNANSYTDTAVSNLVDGAPGLLDTLNELAAAIGDDANFASTITTSIGGKVSKSGDTMTGALTLSGAPTSDLHAATKKYVDDAIGGVTNLTEVVLPEVLLGSEAATAGTGGSTVDTWSTSTYSTAKYLVQMKSGSDIHVLEVLVTVDGGNNVYVTEYAEVISNASLGTTDAAYSSGNINFTVTATNAGTAVKISKTYIEA